ncbi:MAG: isoprenyl transferase [Gammaproteobacteria bacterium]|nr:isoprenyl transferase [Gammaproteobacteria bacterium]
MLPSHIALVMDGNGRWAKKRFLPRTAGHKAALSRVREIIEVCVEKSIPALTLFAFSSENWKRPKEEVGFLMELMLQSLHSEATKLHENNVQLKIIGERSGLSASIIQAIEEIEVLTAGNTGLHLRIAFNYGGRADILQAVQKIVSEVTHGLLSIEAITEELIGRRLLTADIPEPDLFIRTSGEQRISNFLLWQLAYSELYFTETLFPAFNRKEFQQALDWFANRERRFGKISEQLGENNA